MKKNILVVLLLVQITSLSSSEKRQRGKKSTRHRNHWLFPDGDRNSNKELEIAYYFMHGDANCSTIICNICSNNLPRIPEFSSTGDTLKALKLHLDQEHPEKIQEIINSAGPAFPISTKKKKTEGPLTNTPPEQNVPNWLIDASKSFEEWDPNQ